MLTPDFQEFQTLAAAGAPVPIAIEFLADCDTAVTAYARLARPPFGFLLESLVGGEKWARYTFLGTRPRSAWKLLAGGLVSTWTPAHGWSAPTPVSDPLADLEARLGNREPVAIPGIPRFAGGAVGYLGYDVIRYIERLPDAPSDPLELPEGCFIFTDVVLAIDNVFGRTMALTTVDPAGLDRDGLRLAYAAAAERLEETVRELAASPAPGPMTLDHRAPDPAFESSYTREGFEHDVQRIRDYITAGDAFQVVLSQRLAFPLRASPLQLYRGLRSVNPSPYLFFLELDGIALVGSSPEVLVRLEGGEVTVRPIAGTRRRGGDDQEDAALTAELLADPKERAEHLMLVDLGRNDVGRVSRYGSVQVTSYMQVERYSHVLHLVSQVEGQLRPGLSAMDVFRACFPAGTVSGAPKVRAMEILDELEPVRRGVYAGAVGYFGWGGKSLDTGIAIRTLVTRGAQAWVQVGAGIVADSVPAREYEETLAKARALIRVVAAVQGAEPGPD